MSSTPLFGNFERTLSTTIIPTEFSRNTSENMSVIIITCISCFLSIFGTIIIIGTFIAWKDLRTKPREILVYLSIADFLTALGYLYGTFRNYHEQSFDCILQSALTTFANLSSFFWTVSLSVYLYILLVHSDRKSADDAMPGFHILNWGIPFVIVLVAGLEGALGWDTNDDMTVGWCWVDVDNSLFILWVFITGKAWEIVAYFVLPVIYFLIKHHINTQAKVYNRLSFTKQQRVNLVLKMDIKLMLIPMVFVLLRIWGTIRFILFLVHSPVVSNSVLVVLHGFGNSFQGAANCILFCFMTSKIRTRLLRSLTCKCCKTNETTDGAVVHTARPDAEENSPLLYRA